MLIESPNVFVPQGNWTITRKKEKKEIVPSSIARIIEDSTGVNPFKLSKYRGLLAVQSRQIFVEMMARYTLFTYSQIGSFVGKDHSTVNHSRRVIENYLATDQRFKNVFLEIDKKVKAL